MYQNNNNRVNPNEVKDTTLKPQAAPIDKLVKYQPDLTEVNKSKANAEALVKFGQGLMDYDVLLQKQATESALIAYEKTEAINNKKEWARVSKNVQGMAKFNPYIKDSYRGLVAQDIYRMSVLKINSNPNLHKMSEEEFNKFIQDTKAEMFEAFKESNIDPRNYANFIENFSKDCYNTSQAYTVKNSEYNYKNSLIRHGSDLGFNLGANTFQTADESEKLVAITDTINQKINECLENGIPKDDIAKEVLGVGLQSYIVENSDTINSKTLETAINAITIDGTPLREIIPNYSYEVHQMIRKAKRADYEDRRADYEDEQLTLKINTDNASRDFFSWFKNNQNATPSEIQQAALGLINQYGIDENGASFLHTVLGTKNIMTELKEVSSDSSVLSELGRKAALGTLTGEDVENALINRQINWKDGLHFIDRINREAKAEVKQFDDSASDFDKKMKKDGIYGKPLRNSKEYTDLINTRNQITMDLDSGKITAEQARKKIYELDRIANSISQMKQSKNKNESLLLNANYIKSQSYPTYSFGTASDAFKNLGYIKGGFGQKIKGNITSGINPNRTINGKNSPHRGYDLGALEGTPVTNCNQQAQVVAAGYQEQMGNYVILKYANGTYARFLHLKNGTSYLQGRQIAPNQRIAYVGNTGHSTGSHLHVDFWNKNMELINVETFAKGIN